MMQGTARALIGVGTLCLLSACAAPEPKWDAPPYYSGNPRYDYPSTYYYEPEPEYGTRTYVYRTYYHDPHLWEHRPTWSDRD